MIVDRARPPHLVGLDAARQNLVPGLLLQIPLLIVVLGFYFFPPTQTIFERVAAWKTAGGYLFSFGVAIAAGAILPELLRAIAFQKGRITEKNLKSLLFTAPFWGVLGVCVDAFYRAQTAWFGSEIAFDVIARKVAVDQFIYSPFFAVPVTAAGYAWRNQGFKWHGVGDLFKPTGYYYHVLPTLMANWCVWLPAVSIIYSLPPLLQIPLFGFALSFWVLIVTTINAANPDAIPANSA